MNSNYSPYPFNDDTNNTNNFSNIEEKFNDNDYINKKRLQNTEKINDSQRKQFFGFDVNKVNNTLEKFHTLHNQTDDDNESMNGVTSGSFKPPNAPISVGSEKKENTENMQIRAAYNYNQPHQQPQPQPQQQNKYIPMPNASKEMGEKNYKEAYHGGGNSGSVLPNYLFPSQLISPSSTEYLQSPITNSNQDILIKKINYMIHLLEENKDERTNNVTEEIILYGFLGVFTIFLVDSFSKVGKYVR
jgi:hypothetical protein